MWLGAACGPAPSHSDRATADDRITLRVAFARIEGADVAVVDRQLERFAAQHPGVAVEIVANNWRGADAHDVWARFLAMGDPAIDVYVIDDPWIAEFAFAGWIRPLDELRPWAETELHDAGLRSAVWRDQLWAVPMELSANALFCRTDLLAAAGREIPRSMEELLETAALLRPLEGHGLVLHSQYLHNDVYPFLWASGAEVVDGAGRVALDNPVAAAVLAELIAAEGTAIPTAEQLRIWAEPPHKYHDAVDAFTDGKAAFMINWLRYDVAALGDRVTIAPIPGLAGRGPGSGATLGSWHWAINASSLHPELAAELLRSLSTREAAEERFVELGTFPPNRTFYDDPAMIARYPSLGVAGPIFAGARPRFPMPNEPEADEIIERELRASVFENRLPAETLRAASVAANAAVAAFPPEPLLLPELSVAEKSPETAWANTIYASAGLLWLLAIVAAGLGAIISRRRGGLFGRLSLKVGVLGLTLLLLTLATAAAAALAVLVQNQQEAITEAQDIFRDSIREHSLSLGRQIALGSSVVSDLSGVATRKLGAISARKREGADDDADRRVDATLAKARGDIDSASIEALYFLAAEGAYASDILFLQILRADGVIIADETDFLVRGSGDDPARRLIDDPTVAQVARFGRRISTRAVPESAALPPHLEVMVPLVESGRHAGAVRIGYSMKTQNDRISALRSRQEHLLSRAVLLVLIAAAALIAFSAVMLLLFTRSISGPLVHLCRAADQVGGGDLDTHCDVAGRDEIATLGIRFNDMVRGLRERQRIKETFGRYVGPSVSELLLSGDIELGGEERDVTLLFSDIRDFTNMSENMRAPDVVRLLNTYFDQMVDAVFDSGGTLDKFIGDGLMAVFGAPNHLPDHAMCAVRCALDMRARLEHVNLLLESEGLPSVRIGIGLHSGSVVVGNIGSSKRTEYTAIGDTVNLAARVEGLTKDHGVDVMMTDAAYAEVKGRVDAVEIGSVAVKGKERTVQVYALRSTI